MKKYCCILIGLLHFSLAFSQYTERKFSKKQEQYTDSLKRVTYNHIFPLMGQKAYKMGFDIPYPVGIMANYFYAKQSLVIENLQLGLTTKNQDIPLTPIDFIGFQNNTVAAHTYNVRPDLWIFPFLSVSGIFGYGSSTTTVNVTTPITLTSVVKQNVKTAGFGITGAFGLGPLFLSMDGNWTWNKADKVEKPIPAQTFGIRLGHSFKFKEKPEKNIAIWAGAMRAKLGSGTVGQINLGEALPPDVWAKKDQIVSDYYTWYNGLNPANPADKLKKEAADKVLTPIIERLDAADGSAVVKYALDKRPAQEWNMVVGGQYQINKHWILRTEGGIVGDRKSFMLSTNYRFIAF